MGSLLKKMLRWIHYDKSGLKWQWLPRLFFMEVQGIVEGGFARSPMFGQDHAPEGTGAGSRVFSAAQGNSLSQGKGAPRERSLPVRSHEIVPGPKAGGLGSPGMLFPGEGCFSPETECKIRYEVFATRRKRK
jgi:hypothetical protein